MVVEDLIELLRTLPQTATLVGYFFEEVGGGDGGDVIAWPTSIDEAVYTDGEAVLYMSLGKGNDKDTCHIQTRGIRLCRRMSLAMGHIDGLVDQLFDRQRERVTRRSDASPPRRRRGSP